MIKFACALVVLCLFSVVSCDLGEEALNLDPQVHGAPFEESHTGFDLHKDSFYYVDDYVQKAFERSKYTTTRFTLAGQSRDLTGHTVSPSLYPFIVAQKSLSSAGKTSKHRWDIKDTTNGYQFIGLYQARNGDFIANKLRAHLLRRLANYVQPLLPSLDSPADKSDKDYQKKAKAAMKKVRDEIETIFVQVDMEALKDMKNNDDTSADAAVAVITKKYIITATVGENRIVSYDTNMAIKNLTAVPIEFRLTDNYFGGKKNKEQPCRPFIQFHERFVEEYEEGYVDPEVVEKQLLLFETSSTTKVLNDLATFKLIIKHVNQHKAKPNEEQEIFRASTNAIMETIESKLNFFDKIKNPDHTVILVSLTKDYQNIH